MSFGVRCPVSELTSYTLNCEQRSFERNKFMEVK